MDFKILSLYKDVAPHMQSIIAIADATSKELGFLPHSAYEEQALQGKLWVCIDCNSGDYAGHLMFGLNFPMMRVTQLHVHSHYRRHKIGSRLVSELVSYGESRSYLSIIAKVASDIPANKFWENIGFITAAQKLGGESTGRIINHRVKELNTPSLLTLMTTDSKDKQTLTYDSTPWLKNPLYLLDLNILLDIVKGREFRIEASNIIRAALNNLIRTGVTPEFIVELEKNQKAKEDPLVDLARKAFPIVPLADVKRITQLLVELKHIVFPSRNKGSKRSKNDHSDLVHLATCITSKARGFITREKAMLRVKEVLFERYNIEILSPSDLSEPLDADPNIDKEVKVGAGRVKIYEAQDGQIQEDVVNFLKSLGISESESLDVWAMGTTGAVRRRIKALVDNVLVAVASWDLPTRLKADSVLYLFVDEDNSASESIIDHIYETVARSGEYGQTRKMTLKTSVVQVKTRESAIKRGFVGTFSGGITPPSTDLIKVSHNGLIFSDNWAEFRRNFYKLTGYQINEYLPNFESVNQKVVSICDNRKQPCLSLSVHDFETFISPGLIVGRGREAILLPIQANYAADLGISLPRQLSLLPAKEALLHSEKAYFRNISGAKNYESGQIVIFYLSGACCDSKTVAGCGRFTYSGVHHLSEIDSRFSRQGVLDMKELKEIANKKEEVHVLVFSSYNNVQNLVDYRYLKNKSHISKANLVTGEKKQYEQFNDILRTAFL